MGQGTDSCGGDGYDYYDDEEDEYSDALASGCWKQRDGKLIEVSSMSISHLQNAKRTAALAKNRANSTSEQASWQEWIETFDNAIHKKRPEPAPVKAESKPARGAKVKMVCNCGHYYEARQADVSRGWGLSCSKSCASVRREFKRPAATPAPKEAKL